MDPSFIERNDHMMEEQFSRPWLRHYDANVSPSLSYPELTFSAMFEKTLRTYPDQPALLYMGNALRFWDMDRIGNQFVSSGKCCAI